MGDQESPFIELLPIRVSTTSAAPPAAQPAKSWSLCATHDITPTPLSVRRGRACTPLFACTVLGHFVLESEGRDVGWALHVQDGLISPPTAGKAAAL